MKLKDWIFLILMIALFGVSMFYPKTKEQNNNWQECYSISFVNGNTTTTYFTSSTENNYSNKSIKIKFDNEFCHVEIINWQGIKKQLTLLRENSNMVINYK